MKINDQEEMDHLSNLLPWSGNIRHEVQHRMISVDFFRIFEIIIFCFDVASARCGNYIHLFYVLIASGNLF